MQIVSDESDNQGDYRQAPRQQAQRQATRAARQHALATSPPPPRSSQWWWWWLWQSSTLKRHWHYQIVNAMNRLTWLWLAVLCRLCLADKRTEHFDRIGDKLDMRLAEMWRPNLQPIQTNPNLLTIIGWRSGHFNKTWNRREETQNQGAARPEWRNEKWRAEQGGRLSGESDKEYGKKGREDCLTAWVSWVSWVRQKLQRKRN